MAVQSTQRLSGLEELLDRLCATTNDRDEISISRMVEAAGKRSFGPLLLLLGLIVLSPLSGIPGLPTTIAVMVLAIAGQLLIGRRSFWFPQWFLRRHIGRGRVERALRFLRPLARGADRFTRSRWHMLTEGVAVYPIAMLCILIAVTMPPLEVVPFANSAAGAALTALGLALITQDGVLAAIAIALCAGGIAMVVTNLL